MPPEVEAHRNYRAFLDMLPALIETHPDQCALLHDGQLVEIYETSQEARWEGRARYGRGRFSVQQITDTPANFGWFSHVWG